MGNWNHNIRSSCFIRHDFTRLLHGPGARHNLGLGENMIIISHILFCNEYTKLRVGP
jgi:hypothetical protein